MNVQARVAWNLRRIRVARGLSQEQLAIDAAVDRTYISRLERKTENPTIIVLERIAVALDVDVVELVEIPRDEAAPQPLKPGRRKK